MATLKVSAVRSWEFQGFNASTHVRPSRFELVAELEEQRNGRNGDRDHEESRQTAAASALVTARGIRRGLLRVLLLLLDIALNLADQPLLQLRARVVRVANVLKLVGGVLASQVEHDLRTTGMVVQELGHVVHLAETLILDDHPAILSGRVLGHLLQGELLQRRGGLVGHGRRWRWRTWRSLSVVHGHVSRARVTR